MTGGSSVGFTNIRRCYLGTANPTRVILKYAGFLPARVPIRPDKAVKIFDFYKIFIKYFKPRLVNWLCLVLMISFNKRELLLWIQLCQTKFSINLERCAQSEGSLEWIYSSCNKLFLLPSNVMSLVFTFSSYCLERRVIRFIILATDIDSVLHSISLPHLLSYSSSGICVRKKTAPAWRFFKN